MWLAKLRWLPALAAGLSFGSLCLAQQAGQQYVPQQQAAPQAPLPRNVVQPGVPIGAMQPAQMPATQPVGAAPAGQQPGPLQLPPAFQLDPLRLARLTAVLDNWQTASAKVNTFRCTFERSEYNRAFGPNEGQLPLFKNLGEVSFEKPDKGSFQITQIKKWKWQELPPGAPPVAAADRKGNWEPDPTAVGEHWVCDGKNVYEYRHDQKQLVVRQIPAELQGKAIVDGPLPFLFGAETKKLMARYWLREFEDHGTQHPGELLIGALPKFQADAANYEKVIVILDSQQYLPILMDVFFPNGDHNLYEFQLKNAKINNKFDQFKQMFQMPDLLEGWKRVEEPMPVDQAAQPGRVAK